jgi:predicted Zn-dependent protease
MWLPLKRPPQTGRQKRARRYRAEHRAQARCHLRRHSHQSLSQRVDLTREQQVQNVSRGQNFGFGVRVLFKGTWGFASSRSVTPEDVRRITQQAVEIARANSVYQRKRISLVPSTRLSRAGRARLKKIRLKSRSTTRSSFCFR